MCDYVGDPFLTRSRMVKYTYLGRYLALVAVALVTGDSVKAQNLSSNALAEVRDALTSFDQGLIDLDWFKDQPSGELDTNITLYFQQHPSNITTKMKLPISWSFFMLDDFSTAKRLATEYVNVYSNDWHGWRAVAGAEFGLHAWKESFSAGLKAAALGDDENYTALGVSALKCNRMDVLKRTIIPRLLMYRDDDRFEPEDRSAMRQVLVIYALRVPQDSEAEDIFCKAITGVSIEDVNRQGGNFAQKIHEGCERFKSKAAQELCQKLDAAPVRGFDTNLLRNVH